ncbi:MAG: DUF1795 domain-containing protein [candidate division Zixibacteria bacterium]|nr:DUF1795 domain-containing protein [candidate division Zixibacteria bacterium]MBU1471975.1 DUF1795 domain-containing protein [candidate division Zixibacteria bacterium]MBU2626924.1 DUF1795 domain-containing protein [candidate division Zixibacteria bacterium]
MSETIFKLDIPRGWEDQTVYHFRGPSDGETAHQVTLVLNRQLQHLDVADFAKEWIDPIKSTLQGVDVLKDEAITLDRGNQAHEFVYRWTPSGGVQAIHKYVFVIKDGIGFTFSGEFSKKTLKTVGVGMMKLIEALVPGTYEIAEVDDA